MGKLAANTLIYRSMSGRERVGPKGYWRTFSELGNNPQDEAAVAFHQRYGELSPLTSEGWISTREMLTELATCWSDPDEAGISWAIDDYKRKATGAESIFEHLFSGSFSLGVDGYVFRTESHLDFMLLSATEMFLAQTPMRRCVVCTHWFGLRRNTATTCSGTCRNKKSQGSQ